MKTEMMFLHTAFGLTKFVQLSVPNTTNLALT